MYGDSIGRASSVSNQEGSKPRLLDIEKKMYLQISQSWLKDDGKYTLKNRGGQVVVDAGSISFDDEFITFSCDNEKSGHFDGQHHVSGRYPK